MLTSRNHGSFFVCMGVRMAVKHAQLPRRSAPASAPRSCQSPPDLRLRAPRNRRASTACARSAHDPHGCAQLHAGASHKRPLVFFLPCCEHYPGKHPDLRGCLSICGSPLVLQRRAQDRQRLDAQAFKSALQVAGSREEGISMHQKAVNKSSQDAHFPSALVPSAPPTIARGI